MASKLLEELRQLVDSAPGDPETPSCLRLPQSHFEEVRWFVGIGHKLGKEERDITAEEFRELLALLPRIFTAMVPPA